MTRCVCVDAHFSCKIAGWAVSERGKAEIEVDKYQLAQGAVDIIS